LLFIKTGLLLEKMKFPLQQAAGNAFAIAVQTRANKPAYLPLRLDAFSGLILVVSLTDSAATWVARLHRPLFHLMEGSGHAVQYHPDENSAPRLQPLHCSTIW
jgi:hypothetical protein